MCAHLSDDVLLQPAPGISARHAEMSLWAILLMACNYPLFQGDFSAQLLFMPDLVANGEWHRIFLAPFTHVSWYHLALDSAAFLLLWNGLQENRYWGRHIYFIGCWLGSIVLPLILSSNIYSIGLCGLSGIAHGLFAVTALEMIFHQRNESSKTLGKVLLTGLLAKSGWEMLAGGKVVSALHFGEVGVPIVTSHFGGIIGGCLAFSLLHKLSGSKHNPGGCPH